MKLSKVSIFQIVITAIGAIATIAGAVTENVKEDKKIEEKVNKALNK